MKVLRPLLATLLAVLPAVASALDPGTASGTLIVDGEIISLTHAYAHRQDNAERLMEGPELRVLLADRELPPELLAGPLLSDLERLSRAGGVRGLLMRLGADRTPTSVRETVLHAPRDPQTPLPSLTTSGASAGFKRFVMGDRRVVGEVADEAGNRSGLSGVPRYGYQASFSAPLFEDRRVTAVLEGRDARRSPPARAVLAFEQALREGDLGKARALATSRRWQETERHAASVGETQSRTEIREAVPPTVTRERQIARVVIRDDRARVIYQAPGAKAFVSLAKVDGGWKIAD